jgi:thiol:disulfide interchange protein DsbC
MKKVLFALILALFVAPTLYCAGDVLQDVKGLEIVKNLFPPQVQVIEARDIGSLYEIVTKDPSKGKQIFYVTKDGTYLIAAANVLTNDKVNLTQKRYEEINRVDVSKLPLKDAIEIKKGNGAKKLITFIDVDCPFCRKSWDWLKTQTDYTLYVFLLPLEMHPQSAGKSVQVLCAKDSETALDKAQSGAEIGSKGCEAGEKMLARQKDVAAENGVDGTPLFITGTGSRITGFNTQALESYLKN